MPAFRTGETFDASRLARFFVVMDNLEAEIDHVANAPTASRVLTARKLDEAQPAGPRTYLKAGALLNAGFDNMHAFKVLLTNRLTQWAPWTLIRAVFETGFMAQWVLEHPDGAIRRQRGLRLSILDQKEWLKWANSMTVRSASERLKVEEKNTKVTGVFRAESSAMGLDYAVVSQSFNMVQELAASPTLRNESGIPNELFEGAWRSLSGIQHGYSYALMAHSDIDAKIPVPGGAQVVVTVNDEMLEGLAMLSMWLLWEAGKTYVRRSSQA